jgi:hypothetical protein
MAGDENIREAVLAEIVDAFKGIGHAMRVAQVSLQNLRFQRGTQSQRRAMMMFEVTRLEQQFDALLKAHDLVVPERKGKPE